MRKVLIKWEYFLFLLVAVYPVWPTVFAPYGINGATYCGILFGLVSLLFFRKISNIQINVVLFVWHLWILMRVICLLVAGLYTNVIQVVIQTFVVFFLMYNCIRKKDIFIKTILFIVYSSGVVSILGVIEEITHFNVFGLLNKSVDLNYNPLRFGILRIITFSAHTIVYGVYLMFCMSFCLYCMQFVKNNTKRMNVLKIIYLLLWINELLTLSRSAILCAVISQVLILYFMGFRKMMTTILKYICVIGVLLFFASFFIPQLLSIITKIWYMILAVFNDNYTSAIVSSFGKDNLGAVGNRNNLYSWVLGSMDGHWMFGYGANAQFTYDYISDSMYIITKSGIEVHYLNVLYHYGLVGLIGEIILYIGILASSIKNRLRSNMSEKEINFNAVCVSIFISYILVMFAVNQSSDKYIFYLTIIMFIIYNKKSLSDRVILRKK